MMTFKPNFINICLSEFNTIKVHLLSYLLVGFAAIVSSLSAQTVIGGSTPDPSALLDIQSNSKGMLMPRMTTTQRNSITAPATGLMIFNTTTVCLEINLGTTAAPSWLGVKCLGSITALNCSGATLTGTLQPNQAASGVSVSVPYTGGNGGIHAGQTVSSTGVTGLTATLAAGSFASGSGNLTYSISGTSSGSGTANFALEIAGQSCTLALTVQTAGTISGITCSNAAYYGRLFENVAASGVTIKIPYTGGNGGGYAAQTVNSADVSGLTATLAAGTFATGADSLTIAVSGTAAENGLATFALNIGGQTCTLELPVGCGAYIDRANSIWQVFACHNLGAANTSADPFSPTWEIHGGYWQWGIKNQAAPGPTGTGTTETNEGSVTGWNSTTRAADNAWDDSNITQDDPCPSGFRVPSVATYSLIIDPANNTAFATGTWGNDPTNYGTGKWIGKWLLFPAAGSRDTGNGALDNRARGGGYWTSSIDTNAANADGARYFNFDATGQDFQEFDKLAGFSLRCVKAQI